jgi:hypothetical protein
VGMHRRRRVAIERVGGVDEKKLGARRLRGAAERWQLATVVNCCSPNPNQLRRTASFGRRKFRVNFQHIRARGASLIRTGSTGLPSPSVFF